MDWVLGVAGVGIVLVLVWTVIGARKTGRAEERGHQALAQTQAKGVEPVSLHPVVDTSVCVGTGACVAACPEVDVLSVIEGQARLANPTACIGHGECLVGCPVGAISLRMGSAKRGVDLPLVNGRFETQVPGLYVVGELGGMGLVYNAMTQGMQCVQGIARKPPANVPGGHQLLIVGAGPAGLAATLAAMHAKLDVVTLDQESIGGTVLQYPRHKVVMTKPIKLPLYGKLQVGSVRKEDLLAKWQDIVEKTGVEVQTGVKVEKVSKGTDGIFDVLTSKGPMRASSVVLALGRRGSPRKLGVPGEDTAKVTYRLLEPENYQSKRVLVVGGGDSAVEAAVALAENQAVVHLAYRRETFSRIKPKNQQRLDDAVAAETLSLLLKSTPLSIHADKVRLKKDEKEFELANDYVLVLAGGVLPTQFLKDAGVHVETFKGEVFAPAN